ncbi:MAG: signal recognition particle protein [Deltaproteobacteria bacterium]|nr:signal recognition particle protein [Deltaproteobacteria bacterium]
MLETVTKGFRAAKDRLTKGTIDRQAIDDALRDIRLSLLEADVDFAVAKSFLEKVQARAEQEVLPGSATLEIKGELKQITPYHRFVAICQEELETLMGPGDTGFELAPMGVTCVMMVGLQGSGKTTTAAKIARWIGERHDKKTVLVAADLQRPAAIDQLEQLGKRVDVPVFVDRGADPLTLCGSALAWAGKHKKEVVIFDTAGRLAIDEALMNELRLIKDRTKPQEILLVVDAMIGQDAVRTAKAFDEALGITGFVMTKLDGDARGGAALSIKAITGKPIKFLGTGETMEAIEAFRPEGLASRILGMGDVVGLVKEFERHVDQDKAEADAERMFRGQFDMSDFVDQIGILRKMGSLSDLLEKMPIFQNMPAGFQPDEREFAKIEAVHASMTPTERRRPAIMREKGRIERVARGIGRPLDAVADVLNRYDTMRRMMIALGDQPSLLAKLPGFDQLAKVRKLRGLDLSELFGDLFDLPEEPDEEAEEAEEEAPAAAGRPRREYFANMSKPKGASQTDKSKKKAKRKQEAQQRKKARKGRR